MGLLFSYDGLLGVALQLPVTAVVDRMKATPVIVASGIALAAAFGALLGTAALPSLLVAVTLVAFAGMLAGPLVQTLAADLAPPASRTTYMAAFSVVQDVRDAAGPAAGMALYAVAATLPWLVGIPIVLIASGALATAAHRHERTQRLSPTS